MRKCTFILYGLMSAIIAAPAVSAPPKASFASKGGVITTSQFVNTSKGGEDVTCKDFLGLADQFKPQAVSYAIGLSKGHNPKAKVIDVTDVGKIVPVIVSTCRSRPHGALQDTVSTVLYRR